MKNIVSLFKHLSNINRAYEIVKKVLMKILIFSLFYEWKQMK